MIEFVSGDFFEYDADIMVNTVNCVGVMGAGVALAFKKRFPELSCEPAAGLCSRTYAFSSGKKIYSGMEIRGKPVLYLCERTPLL